MCVGVSIAQIDSEAATRIIVWSVALIAVVLVFGTALMLLRRSLSAEDKPAQGLMLDDLRKLRDTGQISSEEFDRAVGSMANRDTDFKSTSTIKNERL